MLLTERRVGSYTRMIALANLVESQESGGYKYVATRVYDTETDIVADVVLESQGHIKGMSVAELHYALWRDLPTLDIRTKQLVGKNKDKYCTLISVRVFDMARTGVPRGDDTARLVNRLRRSPYGSRETMRVHILGYTFMDVNGDKRYYTLAQLRKSDILQHTHSTSPSVTGDVYMREVMLRERTVCTTEVNILEIDDTDTTLEDDEVEQIKLLKTLVGGWHTMGADGTIQVDANVVNEQQLEELEVPEGILHISHDAFFRLKTVKRIKLPETVRTIGEGAFFHLERLAEINMPKQVKELSGAFSGCTQLKLLDLSNIERLCACAQAHIEHLILPDVLQEHGYTKHGPCVDVLEFRNVTNAAQRVLKANTGKHALYGAVWRIGRIETNGPVVLGDYKADMCCADVSALEPNIVGIAPNCSFRKIDAEGKVVPWELGPTTEFVYSVAGGYGFTEEAYAANKLRAAVVDKDLKVVLPKSVELLQGVLSESMRKADYPNVVYASRELCSGLSEGYSVADKFPSLRWVLPKEKVLTETQVKRLEKKLTPILPEICERVQRIYALDLKDAGALEQLKRKLLSYVGNYTVAYCIYKEYGMLYVGDYNEVLRGKQ